MKTRILFINFKKNEIDKIRLPEAVEAHYGYLSDRLPREEEYVSEKYKDILKKDFKVYLPLAVHEYKIIFIKLNNDSVLEKEFTDRLEPHDIKHVDDLIDYTLDGKGYVVVLLGDHISASLVHLGIRGITLHQTIGRDITVNCVNEEFNKVFEELESEVIMPTDGYITVDSDDDDFYQKFSSRFNIKNIYKNQAGNILGCYHNNSIYSGDCKPAFFLLPLFRNYNLLFTKLLKEFALLSPKFLSEFYEQDWQKTDRYMPKEVHNYEENITKIVEDADLLVAEEVSKQNAAREKYQFLNNVLSQKHDPLKESVISVLEDVFCLPVTDSDEDRETTLSHEDIIIDFGGEKILVEVKGDNAAYPSTSHIAQLWKHLKHKKEIEKGALILNYDVNVEPEKRKPAYIGEEEHQLDDIIFIDTRALHDLAIAIIDHGMKVEEASAILFKKGRVVFDLDKYVKSKSRGLPGETKVA